MRLLDDALIVLHDDTLDRTTNGHGHYKAMGLDALRALDAGEGERIPLLEEVIALTVGRVDLNIEVKEAGIAAQVVARVREETETYGTREGLLRGFAVTGGVITSAGVVLAGTFLVLSVLPLVFLTELGFTVAFGVLLDTFLVRSILVPALTLDIGSKVWWPSALAKDKTEE